VFGRFPVPSQQGVGGHQEGLPPGSWEKTAERREDRSIGWPIPHPRLHLPFKNTHLVPEHNDLDVLVRLGLSGRHNEAKNATQAEVEE
jgi:hypothetical protein